ncbi:MAG: hypothetical protein IJ899_02600 [Blautia sp.]|nr:hypothetical protein [Blautia sp.]
MEKYEAMSGNLPFTREQMQAAYALNLCTVSVSQIIAYADTTVLEQEYETILNNLNLEYMPKDEALLEIIKRLLETITFFRIQESEKEFIEKEYQQKMKNAIWTAVPNLALLVAGGNPISMGVSLASQVGIGYMNYRKNRAQYNLDRDQQLWKLQRSAVEQFEGLQQQLFEAAWRLADKYNFPDAFRLTEKQIKQYNAILMDEDIVRKYERLDAMREHFAAYPPFWYYFGNTANAIANSSDLGISEEAKEQFRLEAKKYFAYFQKSNEYNLLREDAISAACNLEYVDLLDPVADHDQILKLIDDAARYAGNSFDVHQLCAISYLKNGEMARAAKELRLLVNEDYNAMINAQLLSTIYVEQYYVDQNAAAVAPYRMLSSRVNGKYLFPMPKDKEKKLADLHQDFIANQRVILHQMYRLVLDRFMEKYAVQINQIIPLPGQSSGETYPDSIYLDTDYAREERLRKVELALGNKNREMTYKQEVADVSYSYQIIGILNRLFSAICVLECVQDQHTRLVLEEAVKEAIHALREEIGEIEEKLQDFDLDTYREVQKITLHELTRGFREKLLETVRESVESKTEMQDFAIAETNLVRFCTKEGIEQPEFLYSHKDDAEEGEDEITFFTPDLLSDKAVSQNERVKKNAEMIRCIHEKIDAIVLKKDVVEFYTQEDARMNRYFYNKALQNYGWIRAKTLAVLDDRSWGDCDILFTTEGIMPIIRGKAKNAVGYSDVTWTANTRKKELMMGVKYENGNLDMDALYELIVTLSSYAEKI